jgi:cytochrome c oxidase cbb3-type subunit 3
MSDFVSSGWSLYVAVVTILGLVLCLVLLAIASKRKVMASDNSTGHVWDEDLREMNNPLPRWWVWLFIATVVFSAVYLAFYPGLGSNEGTLKWTSAGQHQAEVDKARAAMAPLYAKFVSQPAEALAKDAQAMAIGERLYANNCAGCHGADARGSKGFPNLTDRDWLGGDGSLDYIAKDHQGRPPGCHAPDGRRGGHGRRCQERRQLRAEPVGQPQQRRGRPAGQDQVRGLCGLPRPGWQGQPGAGCTQPDRQDLAARLG